MDQIVVKTEVQPNGDILLFYVDEHEDGEAGILETNQQDEHILPDSNYVVENFVYEDSPDELEIAQATEQIAREKWQDEDIKRLVTFFIDNKETFLSGTTKKIHLWVVACKTMLTDKRPISCEAKFISLKKKFAQLWVEKQKGLNVTWPYFDLCHQAFHDDHYIKTCLTEAGHDTVVVNMPVQNQIKKDGTLVVKKVVCEQNKDEKVETMLNLYLKHKKVYQRSHNMPKSVWETIAMELGEPDVDYWHKRFLNYKQHYIRMVYKRKELGSETINWPYIGYFDQIYGDDADFHQKYLQKEDNKSDVTLFIENGENSWNEMEKTFLVKYYFDCFHEYQDLTIPKKFLWQEVGRLLDKRDATCKKKYEELKNTHFEKLLDGGYDLSERVPLAILFDNIIAKEVKLELEKGIESSEIWRVEQVDELVQFVYNNIDMVKDCICYYVCWATVANKFQKSVLSCRNQWDELTKLYKKVLNDKKEYPDMQITWRYIDLFDRIFDYGMDTDLLDGYKKFDVIIQVNKPTKVGAKRVTIKTNEDKLLENGTDEEDSYDERGFLKRSKKRNGDKKAFKILEYYLKHKDKFASSQHKKLALWEILARQIGISATECAHRFRNFKQVYTGYVQREINKPEMPILWPYYGLCKKVFGYRAIKSKLKNGKIDSEDAEDWSAKEIKQLINYFSRNYNNLIDNVEEISKWTELARDISRSETCCCDKFLELRKSYRKLKTMKARNPDVKVSWKYFNMIDEIYKHGDQMIEFLEDMEVGELNGYEEGEIDAQEDDDFQYIIVVPEAEDMSNGDIVVQDNDQQPEQNIKYGNKQTVTKWNRRSKTLLLKLYLKYLKAHKAQEINSKEMWTEIATKLDEKTTISCKKMFLKLKNQHKQLSNGNDIKTPYHNLLEKILSAKPKFMKIATNQDLDSIKTFRDVDIAEDKVSNALKYYLQNLEDFVSPKFEQKYLWTELANYISEPVIKIFNKINYMKQNFNSDEDTPFKEILQEIVSKENALRDVISNDPNPAIEEEDTEIETWSDLEVERLLTWYLAHLDKFKNPKFVRSYLWMEASDILKKSPLVCSKKMLEIRSQYRTMVKESPEELDKWKFYNLCQRIYGTGKKSLSN